MVGTIELRMDEVASLDLLVQVVAVVQPQHYRLI